MHNKKEKIYLVIRIFCILKMLNLPWIRVISIRSCCNSIRTFIDFFELCKIIFKCIWKNKRQKSRKWEIRRCMRSWLIELIYNIILLVMSKSYCLRIKQYFSRRDYKIQLNIHMNKYSSAMNGTANCSLEINK